MSMISEQISQLEELRDRIKELNGYWEMSTEKWAKIIDSAITTIKELSAKVASESMERSSRYYNGGWIPCSEQTPSEDEDVLICTEDGRILYAYKGADIYWGATYVETTIEKEVVAWMPLPKPYKEEKTMQKINDEQEEKLDINEEIRELNHVLRTSLHEIESFDAKTEQLKGEKE